MRGVYSLRFRLFALILAPLILMGMLLGYWRYSAAQDTAEDLFDRSLLAAALAISRDVAISGGDALSPSSSDLIHDASGGEVFYHATGPGGIYVTGYAYPPSLPGLGEADPFAPTYFEAMYRGESVRVLRVTERMTIDDLAGDATVTVWQRLSDRNAFATGIAVRAAAVMGALLVTLALVVWFGVKLGLRPLTDLEDAIAARSPTDLSKIRRAVPVEARGIVKTLNRLFGRVETAMDAHQVFISDAAHQLRNPAAAVLSMAEAVRNTKDEGQRRRRTDELVAAARNASRVADQLLSLDRLKQAELASTVEAFDLNALVEEACASVGAEVLTQGVDFEFVASAAPLPLRGDKVFVAEAVKNLIDNALQHGGTDLSAIRVTVNRSKDIARVTVSDDGVGLTPEDQATAFSRFGQIEPSSGSGLGLAIVVSVAERHGGELVINDVSKGASLTLTFPVRG